MYKNIELARGAEAILFLDEDGNLVKQRVKKGYRISEIDEKIRARRTRLEANLLGAARRAGVATPQITGTKEYDIRMEFVDGHQVKGILNEENYEEIAKSIGFVVATLHEADIIHGDLTTSNMILSDRYIISNDDALHRPVTRASCGSNELYLIDFGLGFQSKKIEDKAVDLYLLYHALESTHWDIAKSAWKIILKAYGQKYGDAKKVIKTLSEIEKRGRYKER
jgi:Kae1-associated kinase Bud32